MGVLRDSAARSSNRHTMDFQEATEDTGRNILTRIEDHPRQRARSLLHCLTVSVQSLLSRSRPKNLTFVFDTSEGSTPRFHPDWRPNNRGAMRPTCSSLITIVDTRDSRVVLFLSVLPKSFDINMPYFLSGERLLMSHSSRPRV